MLILNGHMTWKATTDMAQTNYLRTVYSVIVALSKSYNIRGIVLHRNLQNYTIGTASYRIEKYQYLVTLVNGSIVKYATFELATDADVSQPAVEFTVMLTINANLSGISEDDLYTRLQIFDNTISKQYASVDYAFISMLFSAYELSNKDLLVYDADDCYVHIYTVSSKWLENDRQPL